jgi:UDP:flavonoid glycosyltransferase YjiC (YdhE family)
MGHLEPVVGVARALARLGHEPVVLVPPSLADSAAQTGLSIRVGGEPPRSVVDALWERVRAGPPEAVVGLLDRELFAGRCTDAMLAAASDTADRWRPQLVVREPCEYATAVVAHRAGIAQAQIGISQSAIERDVLEDVSCTLERHATGLAGAIEGSPYLTSFPASMDPSPWKDTRRFRHQSAAAREMPDWWPNDRRPLVYVTFGSVLGHLPEAPSVYRVALAAIADLPARVLMTVGSATDPGTLAPIPANTHIERWIAQADVFPHAELVVCHAGSGTMLGALAAGLPLVACPLFADQTANSQILQATGAGVAVSGRATTPGGLQSLGAADIVPLKHAIERVLKEPTYRRAAGRIADEIARQPTLEHTLVRLAPAGWR